MAKTVKKHAALLAALVIISAVCFLFAGRKEGMFIDEIYSYGLSNSYYAPFVTDIKDGDMVDKVMTRQELTDYLAVGKGDSFAFTSVYYNQVQDVHPPLYYWLLNIASSLTPGVFSMWTGLVLDYIIYMLALIMLYALVMELFGSRYAAVAAVLLYGLSTIGLSTMLMIRMYVLLTLLTVLLAYGVVRVMKKGRAMDYAIVAISIFLGLLTQYYYVFYAFFLCGFFVLFALCRKEFRKAAVFAASAFAAVGLFVLVFPACFDHLFADALVSGGSAVDNLKSVWQYPERIRIFVMDSARRMKAIIYVTAAFLMLCLMRIPRLWKALGRGELHLEALILILPAFFCFILVAIISPVTEIRYIYNIVPIFVLADALMFCWLFEVDAEMLPKVTKAVDLIIIAALAFMQARALPPDYLYDEYSDYDALLIEHSDAPCVYMNDNYYSPITYDMLQLLHFEDFLVAAETDSPAITEYVGDAEEIVVFIDISKVWASGFDAREVLDGLHESTGFESANRLYSNGFSDVYLLEVR